jgi:acylphosphatase
VEAELEGTEAAIDMTVIQVERGMFVRIDNISAKQIPVENSNGFSIRD